MPSLPLGEGQGDVEDPFPFPELGGVSSSIIVHISALLAAKFVDPESERFQQAHEFYYDLVTLAYQAKLSGLFEANEAEEVHIKIPALAIQKIGSASIELII